MIKKKEMPAANYDWPMNYYMEFNPEMRLSILSTQDDSQEDIIFMHKLYDMRYTLDKHEKTIDEFTRAWLLMKIDTNSRPGILTRSKLRKTWLDYAHTFFLDIYADCSEQQQNLIVQEWNAFFNQFLHTCSVDKTYGSTFFGVIPLTKDALSSKVASELNLLTNEYPALLDIDELFLPLHESASLAYQSSQEI